MFAGGRERQYSRVRAMTDEPPWYRLDKIYRYARQDGYDRSTALLGTILTPFAMMVAEAAEEEATREKERVKQREQWRLEAQEEYEQRENDD